LTTAKEFAKLTQNTDMIDNLDGIREKDISCYSGKRHSQKDHLKQHFVGDVDHEQLNEDEWQADTNFRSIN